MSISKWPSFPISASQKNEKCSHIINMLRFLIFLFLDLKKDASFIKRHYVLRIGGKK